MHLLLDSSGAELVVAISDERGVILERTHPTGSTLSRDIGAAVGEVVGELKASDFDGIIVGLGPGTFIGSRMAISFANGMAAAGNATLMGVNSLAAIAAVYGGGRCVVLRDGSRNEAYWLGPAGNDDLRLVELDKLPSELAANCIVNAVIEQPIQDSGPMQHRY